MTIKERARGVYESIGGLVPTVLLAAVAFGVLWYALGGLFGWYDSRGARNEANRQKAIAEQAAKESAAAKAEAKRLNDELQKEKGRADALDQRARQLEQERDGLLTDLVGAREATATARRTYDEARRGQAPRRPPAATPDLDRQRRERELCELYPDQCKP